MSNFCKRALTIRERVLGPEHPDTASSLYNLARVYYFEQKYEQAESLEMRALSIRERVLGPEHPDTKIVQKNYAAFLKDKKRRGKKAAPGA